jgi:sugar O-acyltransferase (sialic acid O-acetyltransferase NeuD family)
MILLGGGGFAEELLAWMDDERLSRVEGYLSDTKSKNLKIPHLGPFAKISELKNHSFILAVGDVAARKKAISMIEESQSTVETFIHPTALVSKDVVIGKGVFIGPFCLISTGAVIGDYVFMNGYASVGHHTKIGRMTIFNPYSVVTGNCQVGESCLFGLSSSVLPKTEISDGTRVAAGSSLYRSVKTPGQLWMGVPAKPVKGV